MDKIKEIIEKFNLTPQKKDGEYTGGIFVGNEPALKKYGADEIRANKEEILSFFKAKEEKERKEFEERQARIDAIPGLKEIENAIDDLIEWRREFNKSFEDVGGLGVRPKPEYDLEQMYKDYPVAAAYLKAEKMANKANYELALIGRKALERIIDGENHEVVISDMDKEEKDFVEKHMWD